MNTKNIEVQDALHLVAEATDKQNLNSNGELMGFKAIPGTPFTIIRHENDYFVHMGVYRLTDALTEEEAEADVKRTDWDRLLQVVGIMVENYNLDKK